MKADQAARLLKIVKSLGLTPIETDDDRSERVGFSRVYGERATFVGSGPDHVTLYGDHATRYDSPKFFGEHRFHDDE